jgi:hypothetical protein
MTNNFLVAHKNEISLLALIHKFGHLRRDDIARALWPSSSATTARSMALKTIHRLIKARQLKATPNILGSYSYLLSWIGGNRLEMAGVDGAWKARQNLSVADRGFFHRALATRYLIEQQAAGYEVLGVHAIRRGLYGLKLNQLRDLFGATPDGLLFSKGTDRGLGPDTTTVAWVTVDSLYKPPAEIRKILEFTTKPDTWIDPAKKLLLDRVIFVQSTLNPHSLSLGNAIGSFVLENKLSDPGVLSRIAIATCAVNRSCKWHGFVQQTWQQLQEGTYLSCGAPKW